MVTTSWCGPTAFPRHGPIDAALPAVVSASPLCSVVVTCWVQKEKLDSRSICMAGLCGDRGGWSDPTAKVYAEVYAVREHEAWDLTSLATR